jgi:putative transposase
VLGRGGVPSGLRSVVRMARILRSQLGDGCFHLTGNAVDATALFRDPVDFRAFRALLKQAVRRWRLGLHAYCLMTTHYHALVEGPVERLSPAVQWFQSHYAREHNARFGRKGALFRARFSSWVIHDEAHYDHTIAYILDNPVRAGLVAHREDWPWSWSALGWEGAPEPLTQPETVTSPLTSGA